MEVGEAASGDAVASAAVGLQQIGPLAGATGLAGDRAGGRESSSGRSWVRWLRLAPVTRWLA